MDRAESAHGQSGRDDDGPKLKPPRWRGPPRSLPGGRRQRTHDVEVINGIVYVRLQTEGDAVDSDVYAHRFFGSALDW